MSKNPPTTDKAEFIANVLGDSFLWMAKGLRELQDNHPEIFLKAAKLAGISRRKAYALARIARQFGDVTGMDAVGLVEGLQAGANLFCLHKYSLDLNPIEQIFQSSSTGCGRRPSEPKKLSETPSAAS